MSARANDGGPRGLWPRRAARRQYKTWTLPAFAALTGGPVTVSASSYPGVLSSTDDYFQVQSTFLRFIRCVLSSGCWACVVLVESRVCVCCVFCVCVCVFVCACCVCVVCVLCVCVCLCVYCVMAACDRCPQTSGGLIVMETTLNCFNDSLYSFVTPNGTLVSFVRAGTRVGEGRGGGGEGEGRGRGGGGGLLRRAAVAECR